MPSRFRLPLRIVLVLLAVIWVTGNVLAEPETPATAPAPAGVEPSAYKAWPFMPEMIPYQGVLKDGSGNLVDGEHDITFALWQYSVFGIPNLWNKIYEETQTLTVNNGLLVANIGEVNPLNPWTFDGTTLFGGALQLGIKVDGGSELSPRTPILPVPYAMRAHTVSRYPAPAYDSGWETLYPRPDWFTYAVEHNMDWDPDDYIVEVRCKYLGRTYEGRSDRFYISDITRNKVEVWVAAGSNPDQIRVRLWYIGTEEATP
jgi:hypothetical protein